MGLKWVCESRIPRDERRGPLNTSVIGVRAGGAGGGCSPPKILGNSDFLGSKRNLGKASFKRLLKLFFLIHGKMFSIFTLHVSRHGKAS